MYAVPPIVILLLYNVSQINLSMYDTDRKTDNYAKQTKTFVENQIIWQNMSFNPTSIYRSWCDQHSF